MNFSDDEKHRATLLLLQEVVGYLDRLPPVPVTKAYCAKLRAHLAEPTQMLVAKGRRKLVGTVYSPAGIPLVKAVVLEQHLRLERISLRQATASQRDAQGEAILKAMTSGLRVHLEASNAYEEDGTHGPR